MWKSSLYIFIPMSNGKGWRHPLSSRWLHGCMIWKSFIVIERGWKNPGEWGNSICWGGGGGGTGMCHPSGCTFWWHVFSQVIYTILPIFHVCVLSGMLFNLIVSYVFPQGIQSHAFWSYFTFSKGEGLVVRAAQPRQSWYLSPPPPPPRVKTFRLLSTFCENCSLPWLVDIIRPANIVIFICSRMCMTCLCFTEIPDRVSTWLHGGGRRGNFENWVSWIAGNSTFEAQIPRLIYRKQNALIVKMFFIRNYIPSLLI